MSRWLSTEPSPTINDTLFDEFKGSGIADLVTKTELTTLWFDKKFRGKKRKFRLIVENRVGWNYDQTRIRIKNKSDLIRFDFRIDEKHFSEQAAELVRFIKTQFSLMEETLNNLEKNLEQDD